MDIVHILAGKANPNTLNGVNKVVHSISEEQVTLGFNVYVCGITDNLKVTHHANYNLLLFKSNFLKFLPPFELLKFIISKSRNTVFHLHSAYISWFPFLVIFLKMYGFRYFLSPHGAYTIQNFKNKKRKLVYFYLIEWIILGLAGKIQILGKSEVNRLTSFLLKNKIVYIPNGCYLTNNLNIELKEFIIGYMGRFKIDHKGLDLLLEGFSIYSKNGGNGILELVGDGPDKENLLQICQKHGISKAVKFLGSKFGDEKEKFLQNISWFIHTSRWEGLPTSCLEALSNSKPILVSKETNLGELVSEFNCGLVLPSLDSNEIANALFQIEEELFGEGYRNKVLGTRKIVNEKLSWSIITKRLNKEFYQ